MCVEDPFLQIWSHLKNVIYFPYVCFLTLALPTSFGHFSSDIQSRIDSTGLYNLL